MTILLLLTVTALAADLPTSAEQQDWREVSRHISAKAGLDAAQADGTTAMHWAAYHDRADMVEALIAAGAKADAANRYGITPLLLACENGSEKIARTLLNAGADVHAKRRGGDTVLMVASRTGKADAVQALLEKGAKPNAQDRTGQTALMWAAAEGHAEVIELLVKNGAEVNRRLDSGFTAFLFAAREGKSAAVKELLRHGAEVQDAIVTKHDGKGRDAPNGTSAVLLAMENGHFELVMDLIHAGADPNDLRSGFTALHAVTWVRKPPHGDDEAGQPPPDTHGKLSSLEFIREIVKAGAKVDATLGSGAKARAFGAINFHGATPFLLACRNADLEMMKVLVELGADPHKPNADGSTPLMAAAGLGCYAPDEEAGSEDECVAACDYLISLGADVNAVDRKNQTAMHGAAYKNLPKVARLLAAKGAKMDLWNRPNNRGWTPLLIAQGFRPGNFKPSVPTITAISEIMKANGVEPPPPPDREALPKKKGYEQK
ncbi:ankyrin repeat domain-containing protein [Prosthecobacter sp.]|uniref:ankyrin repeat domain-containing protein n=1 Tax=Prosthecobacter sp. TaxID=1965333 RepID=UPI003783A3A0